MTGPPPAERPVLVIDRAGGRRSAPRWSRRRGWCSRSWLCGRAVDDGQAVAEQSSRSIAASLGRSKDAVARALRQLVGPAWSSGPRTATVAIGPVPRAVRYVVDLRLSGLRLPAEPVAAATSTTPGPRRTSHVTANTPDDPRSNSQLF